MAPRQPERRGPGDKGQGRPRPARRTELGQRRRLPVGLLIVRPQAAPRPQHRQGQHGPAIMPARDEIAALRPVSGRRPIARNTHPLSRFHPVPEPRCDQFLRRRIAAVAIFRQEEPLLLSVGVQAGGAMGESFFDQPILNFPADRMSSVRATYGAMNRETGEDTLSAVQGRC